MNAARVEHGLETVHAALASIDVQGAMVSVSVDSVRINATFAALLAALSKLGESFDANAKSTDQRFASVIDQLRVIPDLKDQVAKASTAATTAESKVAAMAKTVERLTADNQSFAARQRDLEHRVAQLDGFEQKQAETDALVKSLVARVEAIEGLMKDTSASVAALSETTDELYSLFEINQPVDRANVESASARLNFVFNLPFAQEIIRTLEAKMTAKDSSSKQALDEITKALRLKANDSALQSLKVDVEDAVKRVTQLSATTDRVVKEVKQVAAKEEDDARAVVELRQCKADRSELVGFVSDTALQGFREQIGSLSDRLDAVAAQCRLDIANMATLRSPPPPSETPAAVDASSRKSSGKAGQLVESLVPRVVALEVEATRLEAVKIDRDELSEILRRLDELTHRATSPASAVSRLSDLNSKSKIILAPVVRPTSARSTIPESSRPPSPSITYTSLPPQRLPSPHAVNRSATSFLYDSDGSRTVATSSSAAVRSVPAVDHWHNVAAVAAGSASSKLPPSYVEHTMPDD